MYLTVTVMILATKIRQLQQVSRQELSAVILILISARLK
jgi:hypothetical protein